MIQVILAGGLTGILFGFVLQRGRFCMTSGFRDLFLTRDATLFKAYVLALAVQSTGIFVLQAAGIIRLGADPFQWLAAAVGGLIFGISLILSGGCASGTYYRIGEGMVGSLIAAVLFGIGALASRGSGILAPLAQRIQAHTLTVNGATSLHEALGVSPWVLVAGLWVAAILFLVRARRAPAPAWQPPVDESRPWLWRAVFGRGWSWQVTGLAVGLVAVLAWLTSVSTGRMGGLGITGATAGLLRLVVASGDVSALDWSAFLVLGICPVGPPSRATRSRSSGRPVRPSGGSSSANRGMGRSGSRPTTTPAPSPASGSSLRIRRGVPARPSGEFRGRSRALCAPGRRRSTGLGRGA